MTKLVLFLLSIALCHSFPEEENNDPEGVLFGGDILLTPEQKSIIEVSGDISQAGLLKALRQKRAALSNSSILWLPNNKVVPWSITKQLENTAEATFGLMAALREWEERSCLTFKRRTNEMDYIEFFQGTGCWSYLGKVGGLQNISLGNGCWRKGTIVHEIGHAMGFGHEQNRPDRDQYVNIRWENIPEAKKHNFRLYSNSLVDSLNSPYDYRSYMQYSKTAFGINGSVTLDPKLPGIFQLGQRVGFTEHDQYQVMQLYRCQDKTTRPTTVFPRYDLKGDYTCDFETDLCGFTHDKTADFEWAQIYGKTPSRGTGPDTDHTTGRLGIYLYIEASPPQKKNDKARLKTKWFEKPLSAQCFSVFYSMYSQNASMIGEFNIYIDDTITIKNIFSQSKSEPNNDWKNLLIDIKPEGPYQIIFEAIVGNGGLGDIAIDDISITEGICPTKIETSDSFLNDSSLCEDINDREAAYCHQWEQAGYCVSEEKTMKLYCRKSCKFCCAYILEMTKLVLILLSVALCHSFPEEENNDPQGILFGGDILLTPEQKSIIEVGGDISQAGLLKALRQKRAALSNSSILWLPNNKVVPWSITKQLENTAEATFGLMAAFREWEERSCLTFKRRTDEKDYIEFFQGSGCWSYLGRVGGLQNISLDDGCWGKGTIVHEIGHAMGFGHEQNRPDRDQYITIRWENIPESKKHNFRLYSNSLVDSLNSPYDYRSYMQYSKTAFGINDSVTLDPKLPGIFQLGQRVGFTEHDQYQAMQLYRCQGKTTRPTTFFPRYDLKGDYTCDFETDLCGFTHDKTATFEWAQIYGETPSRGTGPDSDHTTGRLGTYVYIEASYPQKKNDKARLKTKWFEKPLSAQCFSVFYNMFSRNASMVGEFNIYIDDTVTIKNIFSQSKSEPNNDWKNLLINIKPEGPYQVIFEGIIGNGWQGDIAIDDISITAGNCPTNIEISDNFSNDSNSCEDINDREAGYCRQWEQAGYCVSEEKTMKLYCRKTCNFC
ncbi:meprin A subunit beta-like isoform X1 [Hydra vulgaris]|uniref:meprin A subunit beta-like isoform X1 n=1 Tax=Hydra vulgaris TaxID=6087 RepID=UPI0032EA6CC0